MNYTNHEPDKVEVELYDSPTYRYAKIKFTPDPAADPYTVYDVIIGRKVNLLQTDFDYMVNHQGCATTYLSSGGFNISQVVVPPTWLTPGAVCQFYIIAKQANGLWNHVSDLHEFTALGTWYGANPQVQGASNWCVDQPTTPTTPSAPPTTTVSKGKKNKHQAKIK